jgi:hypothetical protein
LLRRALSRLTYANVVATLALFAALGGSAYAVHKIGSKQVKNRSLKGVDLRKNTLTGKEIAEKKLGVVKRATAADLAQNAIDATTASLANLATNAQQLGGQEPGVFERSSRTQFGRAVQSPATAADERVLLEWPEINMRVETVVGNNGCPNQEIGLRFRSTSASASPFRLVSPTANVLSSPGISLTRCSGVARIFEGTVGEEDGSGGVSATGRTLYFRCFGFNDVRCFGERSEP